MISGRHWGIEGPEEERGEDYPTQILTAPVGVGEEREGKKEYPRFPDEPEEAEEEGAKKLEVGLGW